MRERDPTPTSMPPAPRNEGEPATGIIIYWTSVVALLAGLHHRVEAQLGCGVEQAAVAVTDDRGVDLGKPVVRQQARALALYI